jgi:hypothetical protein
MAFWHVICAIFGLKISTFMHIHSSKTTTNPSRAAANRAVVRSSNESTSLQLTRRPEGVAQRRERGGISGDLGGIQLRGKKKNTSTDRSVRKMANGRYLTLKFTSDHIAKDKREAEEKGEKRYNMSGIEKNHCINLNEITKLTSEIRDRNEEFNSSKFDTVNSYSMWETGTGNTKKLSSKFRFSTKNEDGINALHHFDGLAG